MKKIPCQCPRCFEIGTLALLIGAAGDLELAEALAREITWFDESTTSEGYAETWSPPVVDNPAVN